MNDAQLELSFGNAALRMGLTPRQRRLSRANWWFERMRQLVDHAFEWQPAPEPRPEQIWFPGAHRQIQAGAEANAAPGAAAPAREEHHVCE
jgi:hypothetical protein